MGHLNCFSEWIQLTDQGLMMSQIKFFHYHKAIQINIRKLLLATHHKNQCIINAIERLKHIEDCNNIIDHPSKNKPVNQPWQYYLRNLFLSPQKHAIGNDNKTFIEIKIESAYNKIVYKKKVLFLIPTGAAEKGFIGKIIRVINCWT